MSINTTPRPLAPVTHPRLNPDPTRAPAERSATQSSPGHHQISRRPRRDEILRGAAELFAEHGYHGASLRAISRSVDISHPGMLHHFPSKENLLSAVIDRLEEDALAAMERTEEFCAEPSALLRGLAQVWNPAAPSWQLLAMLSSDSVSTEHPAHYRMARLRRVYEHVLENCFTALAEQGWLRPGIAPEFAARATMALALALTVREKTVRTMQSDTHDDAPISDLQNLVRSFLTEGQG